jgi:hypothetical protein
VFTGVAATTPTVRWDGFEVLEEDFVFFFFFCLVWNDGPFRPSLLDELE